MSLVEDVELGHYEPAPEKSAAQRPRRALSLDALRGLAILGMVLSGLLPFFNNTLPPWMYHAQTPPPGHVYNAAIVGMTWVDLVFPLFLFALGAAVPLALAPRVDAGAGRLKLSFSAFGRGLLLLFFALYEQHTMPGNFTENYGEGAWWIGLLAFVLFFPIFMRLPKRWPRWGVALVRIAGWAAAFALLAVLRYPDGSGFSVHRHDMIIVILANVAVTTALVWLWFGNGFTARLCIMGLLIALHLARRYAPWGMHITDLQFLKPMFEERWWNGVFWACAPAYQKYLLITIPGTIAGDALVNWLRPSMQRLSFSIQNSRWRELSTVRSLGVGIVCIGITGGVITGFSLGDLSMAAAVGVGVGALGLLLLYSPPARKRLRSNTVLRGQPRVNALIFRTLFTWGLVWLLLGLALYPYQGGIRKDPATLSYLFVSAGLAHMLLVALAVVTDAMHRPGLLFLLVDNGQNPMIAYVAAGMVVLPLLHLIPAGAAGSVHDWLMASTSTPWLGFARGLGLTVVVAVFVSLLTRLKIYWRT